MGSLDESYPIRDAERLFSFDSTNRPVEMHIYQEEQEDNTKNNENTLEFQQEKYDSKTKSKQSRPFKPALYRMKIDMTLYTDISSRVSNRFAYSVLHV